MLKLSSSCVLLQQLRPLFSRRAALDTRALVLCTFAAEFYCCCVISMLRSIAAVVYYCMQCSALKALSGHRATLDTRAVVTIDTRAVVQSLLTIVQQSLLTFVQFCSLCSRRQ